MKGLESQERQDIVDPSAALIVIGPPFTVSDVGKAVTSGRKSALVVRVVIHHSQAELLHVVRALHLTRCFTRILNCGKKQAHQDTDDGDDDQQLNERESIPFSHFVSPSYFHYFNFSLPTVLSPIPRCIGERKRSAAVLLYRFIPRLFKTVVSFRGGEA